jgi:hypothetical protein
LTTSLFSDDNTIKIDRFLVIIPPAERFFHPGMFSLMPSLSLADKEERQLLYQQLATALLRIPHAMQCTTGIKSVSG